MFFKSLYPRGLKHKHPRNCFGKDAGSTRRRAGGSGRGEEACDSASRGTVDAEHAAEARKLWVRVQEVATHVREKEHKQTLAKKTLAKKQNQTLTRRPSPRSKKSVSARYSRRRKSDPWLAARKLSRDSFR